MILRTKILGRVGHRRRRRLVPEIDLPRAPPRDVPSDRMKELTTGLPSMSPRKPPASDAGSGRDRGCCSGAEAVPVLTCGS